MHVKIVLPLACVAAYFEGQGCSSISPADRGQLVKIIMNHKYIHLSIKETLPYVSALCPFQRNITFFLHLLSSSDPKAHR